MMALQHPLLFKALAWLEVIFFSAMAVVTVMVVVIIMMAIADARQHQDAIRHNYPVIGRFRDWFLHLGVFFRAYFFAQDRQEMPFNRSNRNWVYHAASNKNMTQAFGSTRSLCEPGKIIFINSIFPPLACDHVKANDILFGPYCCHPYTTNKFFHISAMSFGALSAPAVIALSNGAKLAGILLDTGEGGIAPYHLDGSCDLVVEIGSAKYGFRTLEGKLDDHKLREAAKLPQVKMFSIKLGQGAKPGRGGILPAKKVTPEIAKIRGIAPGKESISPNRWPEISNVNELLDMIAHIRDITGKPVGFKFVMGFSDFIEELCCNICHRGIKSAPDFIILDSADGGTGAAPMSLIDYVGLTIRESLPLLVNALIRYDLRQRIKIGCSGKLIDPSKVAFALAMGADYVNCARGFMFSLGCIQAMRCHKNSCPTGVTTHRRHLQAGLDPKVKRLHVMHYANNIHYEVGIIAHSCGVDSPRKLNRSHVHITQNDGKTISAVTLWPYPPVGEAITNA